MNKPLKIKKEFKNLIRPLHRQEYLQLEENILADGCRDPIITWNGYIVDGHNRYEICTKHGVEYEVLEKKFNSNEEAIAWICISSKTISPSLGACFLFPLTHTQPVKPVPLLSLSSKEFDVEPFEATLRVITSPTVRLFIVKSR